MNILLVEDNLGDVELLREALCTRTPAPRLLIARDGLDAAALLAERERRGEAPPDLIILDLNLPRMDGRELLHSLKEHPLRRRIPIVVMTSSSAPQDVQRVSELRADWYLVKPLDFGGFEEAVERIFTLLGEAQETS